MNPAYAQRDYAGYVPIDEWLDQPSVRISRALRHFDEATSLEISQALDLGESEIDAFDQAMCRLVKSGHVARSGERGAFRYRLVRELEPPTLPEPKPEDGDERPGEFFWRGKWRKNDEHL